jgi:hypothetical protein
MVPRTMMVHTVGTYSSTVVRTRVPTLRFRDNVVHVYCVLVVFQVVFDLYGIRAHVRTSGTYTCTSGTIGMPYHLVSWYSTYTCTTYVLTLSQNDYVRVPTVYTWCVRVRKGVPS